jgi:hypothetical protein
MKKNYPFILIFIISILNYSCPKPVTPAFLIITEKDFEDCIDVSDFNSTHDKNYEPLELDAVKQQKFSDVWVSLNGKDLAPWQLPCTIPLLPDYSGTNYIRVIPCVRTPNTTTTTLQYYFVTPVEQFIEMREEGEYHLSAFKVKYVPSVDFPVLETFMQSTDFKPFLDINPTSIEIYHDDTLQKNIGKITLTDSVKFFDIVTSYFILKGKDERQFWEIKYKSDNGQMVMQLGFENTISGITHYDVMVFPSTHGVWKKAYMDITDIIRQASNIAPQLSVRLRITGIRDKANSKSEFYFENIKLITMYAPY